MAWDPTLLTGNFSNFKTREGDVGIGHEYLAAAMVKRDEFGTVIGPGLAHVAKNVAGIIWEQNLIVSYREPYRKMFMNRPSKRKIRSWVGSDMSERATHAPTIPPTAATSFEAVDYALRGGWGWSDMFAREYLKVEHPFYLKSLASRVGMNDKIEEIIQGCNHVGHCLVEAFVVDGWLGEGDDATPWLWDGFEGDDKQTTKMLTEDEFIDPEMHEDLYRYSWAVVKRAGLIYWMHLNQNIFTSVLNTINQVDSSQKHPGGESA